jgi:hypothetical protein
MYYLTAFHGHHRLGHSFNQVSGYMHCIWLGVTRWLCRFAFEEFLALAAQRQNAEDFHGFMTAHMVMQRAGKIFGLFGKQWFSMRAQVLGFVLLAPAIV